MQRHEIILNRGLQAQTPSVLGNLVLQNNYYVYTQKVGGGLTSPFNVRAYLNSPTNQTIINQFIQYLEENTNDTEFLEIYYDDNKLSNLFNTFFETTIQNGNVVAEAVIDENFENTITIVVSDRRWNWNGQADQSGLGGEPKSIINSTRNQDTRNELVSTTEEDSYYIPVQINHHWSNIPREKFKLCDDMLSPQMQSFEFYMDSQELDEIYSSINAETFVQNISQQSG